MSGRLPLAHALVALVVVAIWGTNFVVIHAALLQFKPLTLATLRFALAAFPLLVFIKRPRVNWRNLAAYGLLTGAGQFGLLYIAMKRDISPGLASLVIQAQVFFTIAMAALLLRERIHRLQLAALAAAAAGLLVIALHGDAAATPRGIVLTLASAACWAGANLLVKRAGPVNPLAYVVWTSLFAVPPLLGLALASEGWASVAASVVHANALGWSAVLWQAFANSILGYGLWSWLLARHPVATVAPTAMLVPIFGLGASALVLGEAMPGWKILAATLVVAGLAINMLAGRQARPPVTRGSHDAVVEA
jgi:O-acetylserine/cysteine efflux transporter